MGGKIVRNDNSGTEARGAPAPGAGYEPDLPAAALRAHTKPGRSTSPFRRDSDGPPKGVRLTIAPLIGWYRPGEPVVFDTSPAGESNYIVLPRTHFEHATNGVNGVYQRPDGSFDLDGFDYNTRRAGNVPISPFSLGWLREVRPFVWLPVWAAENPDHRAYDALIVPGKGRAIFAKLIRAAVAAGKIEAPYRESIQREMERIDTLLEREERGREQPAFRRELTAQRAALADALDTAPEAPVVGPDIEPIGLDFEEE